MTTRITVASIEQKPKRSVILTHEGRRYGCFSEKLAAFGFELGGVYDVETTTHESGGMTLTNIVKASRVAAASPQLSPAQQPATAANGGGNGHGNGHYPQPATFRTPEQMFVQGIIEAYIGAGRCANPTELKDTITKIRCAWQGTFGLDDRAFTPGEAGRRPHLVAAE